MSGTQFLNAVALGQITPGPVVLTASAPGYAVHGLSEATLATVVAFAPLIPTDHRGGTLLRSTPHRPSVAAFIAGAGPSVIGAIGASSVTLAMLLTHLWQWGLLAVASMWSLALGRNATSRLVVAGVAGALITLASS